MLSILFGCDVGQAVSGSREPNEIRDVDSVAGKCDKGKTDCESSCTLFVQLNQTVLHKSPSVIRASLNSVFWISGSNPHYKPEVVTYPYVDFGKKIPTHKIHTSL